MSNVILLIVQLVSLFLRNARQHHACPDGVCDEPLATAATLKAQLKSPKVGFGFFDFFKLVRCVPVDRVLAVGKRLVELFKGCGKCPDGDCSFFDILGCLDLEEAVAIGKEILDIIRDSKLCDGDESDEITLGQAAG